MGVPASSLYGWQQGQQRAVGRPKVFAWETALVKTIGMNQRYGTRRLRVALREKGHARAKPCAAGAYEPQPKAYSPRTTDVRHRLRCAPNRLLD
jgi:hypothetical protein